MLNGIRPATPAVQLAQASPSTASSNGPKVHGMDVLIQDSQRQNFSSGMSLSDMIYSLGGGKFVTANDAINALKEKGLLSAERPMTLTTGPDNQAVTLYMTENNQVRVRLEHPLAEGSNANGRTSSAFIREFTFDEAGQPINHVHGTVQHFNSLLKNPASLTGP